MEVEIKIRSPKIALMNGSPRAKEKAKEILQKNGLDVIYTTTISEYLKPTESAQNTTKAYQRIDAIFADIDEDLDDDLDLLDQLLHSSEIPVVFSDSYKWEDYDHWGRRISIKLFNAIQHHLSKIASESHLDSGEKFSSPTVESEINLQQAEDKYQKVWVLAASLGGPEAVKEYLSKISATPSACFILAQHIGEGFSEILSSQMDSATPYLSVEIAKSGTKIENGKVIVVPVGERVVINPNGIISTAAESRPSIYKPCIDFVIEEVAQRYGSNSGVIVFTGMGDDGAKGCGYIAKNKGTVLAQTADTCVISSMPDCARETGYVSYSGDLSALANKTLELLGELSNN